MNKEQSKVGVMNSRVHMKTDEVGVGGGGQVEGNGQGMGGGEGDGKQLFLRATLTTLQRKCQSSGR